MMFNHANELLGACRTLHDLRHTATYRMTEDPEMSLVHVQQISGHKDQRTLKKYLGPSRDEVISAGLAHHARQEAKKLAPPCACEPHQVQQLIEGVLHRTLVLHVGEAHFGQRTAFRPRVKEEMLAQRHLEAVERSVQPMVKRWFWAPRSQRAVR